MTEPKERERRKKAHTQDYWYVAEHNILFSSYSMQMSVLLLFIGKI